MSRFKRGPLAWGLALVLAAGLISGCATTGGQGTMSDDTRTKAEGTAVGAVVGGLLGYVIGGDATGAAIGAAIGAGVGFGAGYALSERKKKYASTEDFLNAEIQRTAQYNNEARKTNQAIRTDIAGIEQSITRIRADYDAGKLKKKDLAAEKKKQDDMLAKLEKMEKQMSQQYQDNLKTIKEEKKNQDQMDGEKKKAQQDIIARLEAENAELSAQMEELRTNSTQLAQITERLSV